MTTPYPREYGWIYIDTPELLKQHGPVKGGDEVPLMRMDRWYWMPFKEFPEGHGFSSVVPKAMMGYRRRINPGEGWELLPIGSTITKGDEFTVDGLKWEDVSIAEGAILTGSLDRKTAAMAVRRRKAAPLSNCPRCSGLGYVDVPIANTPGFIRQPCLECRSAESVKQIWFENAKLKDENKWLRSQLYAQDEKEPCQECGHVETASETPKTRRDELAEKIFLTWTRLARDGGVIPEHAAIWSYCMADAMIAESKKNPA